MKKRRELDALVGVAKSRRKTSKSGHELLRYNGSDSSDGDDYSVITKKTRGSGICTTCTNVLTFLLLVACMLVCAGLTWMHVEMKKDLETIRQGLETVESKTVVSVEDIQKLNSLVSSLNKSLEQQGRQVAQVQVNITTVNDTVSKLSAEVAKLGEGLKSAPELKQVPEKLQTVSKSLASLGSDVTGMKDTVAGLQTSVKDTDTAVATLTQQIKVLNKTAGSEKEPDNSLSPELANLIQSIPEKIQDINSTLSAKVSLIMKSLTQKEERFIQLENVTETLRQNLSTILSDHTSIASDHSSMANLLTSDQFKLAVTDLVSKLNLTSAIKTDDGNTSSSEPAFIDTMLGTVKESLDRIHTKYDNISVKVQKNIQEIDDIKETFVPIVMFNTFGEGYQTTIQNLNETLQQLRIKLGSKNDTQSANQVTNSPGESKTSDTSSTEISSKATTKSPETEATNKEPIVSPTKPPNTSTVNTNTNPPEQTRSPDTKSDHITIPGIETAAQLESSFISWDRMGSGKISPEILPDFLGRVAPSEDDLKPFDEDHDGFYTIFELAKALGIPKDPSFDDFLPGREG